MTTAMLPSAVRASRDQRARKIRKLLHDHIEEAEHGCSCGAKRPVHRSSAAWWVEHVSDVLASES